MTADLYQTLGIGKKATWKQVREAYREKAKTAHPDTGGSPEKFALVKRAYDILTDDERRSKYDANGDTSEPKRDDSLQMSLNILSLVLDKVLAAIDRKGADPVSFNIVGDMKTMLGGDIDNLENAVAQARRATVKAEKMLGRFKVKKGENFLEGVIRQKVETVRKNAQNLEEQLATGKKAMDMLKGYEFKHDAAQSSAFSMADLMAQAGVGMRF